MREVSIPVHPMTLRALQAEYGQGPIVMSNHDPLFTFLTCSPLRTRMMRSSDLLSTNVTFMVDDRLALHLQTYDWQIGSALLKMHKQELCKFAATAVMLGYKGGAKSALYVWLTDMKISEDEYSLETAYKLWQRFGWKYYAHKSSTFLAQMRGKAADILSKKRGVVPKAVKPLRKNQLTLPEIEIELAAHRFTKAVGNCFSRPAKKLAGHARIYYYVSHTDMSTREVSKLLGIPHATVTYATRSIRHQAEHNITLRRLLADALPNTVPVLAPSDHGTSIACSGAALPSQTRFSQTPGTDRSARSRITA